MFEVKGKIEDNFEGFSSSFSHVQKAHNSIVPYNTKHTWSYTKQLFAPVISKL